MLRATFAAILVTAAAASGCGASRLADGSEAGCGSCHGFPPAGNAHPWPAVASATASDCRVCHTATIDANGLATDGHGRGYVACTGCHPTRPWSAGSHATHLLGATLSNGFRCASCHPAVVSYGPGHANLTLDVAFTAAVGGIGGYTASSKTCTNTWCHGTFAGGTGADPAWTGAITCTSCHANPPATGRHATHVTVEGLGCGECHPGYTPSSVARALHVDGEDDVRLSSGTWDAGARQCSSTDCHGTRSW